MAIFSRRVVQRNLDALKPYICDPQDARDLVGRLNTRREIAISTEWEIMIGASLVGLSKAKYQKRFGGRNPDFLILAADDGKNREFLIDIVAPSDKGVSKENAADFFLAEFDRITAKYGLLGGFDIRIGDRMNGNYPQRKRQLLLPPKSEISGYIKGEIRPFLSQIVKNPEASHAISLSSGGTSIAINYDPSKRPFNNATYGICESAFSLQRNTLFRKLDEKATQLRQSGYAGIKGIMVADGDCRALQAGGRTGGSPWSRDEIVEHFLARHHYIHFVTTTHSRTVTTGGIHEELSHKVYWQRPFDQTKIDGVFPILNLALRGLPSSKKSPANAWLELRAGDDISNGCEFGACSWIPNRRLEYSSRTFLEILAGTMNRDRFWLLLDDRMPNRGPLFQFFRFLFQSGQKLSSVSVEVRPDDDDDLIVFDLVPTRTHRVAPPPANSGPSFEIPAALLIRFFARLAHEALLHERPLASVGALPVHIQAFVRTNLSEGKTLVDAKYLNGPDSVRLLFGEPDPALFVYR